MSIYVAQTVLTRMLRGATDVRVIVKLLSKSPARFSASFTINGQGDFVLCTDGFKPRRRATQISTPISRKKKGIASAIGFGISRRE